MFSSEIFVSGFLKTKPLWGFHVLAVQLVSHSEQVIPLRLALRAATVLFKISATFVLLWHRFVLTFLRSADCCGVAFKGQSDASGGSAVISVAGVSTETRLQWAERSQVAKR